MPNTFELIASSTVGSGGASDITFSSIPSTYTDLCLRFSGRSNYAGIFGLGSIQFNGDTGSNYSMRRLNGSGSAAASAGNSGQTSLASWDMVGNNSTANTFCNADFYIPNYAGSTQKSISVDCVGENNGTEAYATFQAGLWSGTAAINSIKIFIASQTILQHSTAYLYGVKNA
jgi:hypothetical protein